MSASETPQGQHIGFKTVALLLGFTLAFIGTMLEFISWFKSGGTIDIYQFFLVIILTAIGFPIILYVAHLLWVLWYKTEVVLGVKQWSGLGNTMRAVRGI